MEIEQILDNFQAEFQNKFHAIDFSPCFPKVIQIIKNSIDRNFQEGGRYGNDNPFGGGSQKWPVSHRAKKDKGYKGKTRSGKTLIDTGQLVASIQVSITQSGSAIQIDVGSNKDYAKIHNEGGTIQKESREGSAKWKVTGNKKTGYKYKFAKANSKTKNTIERKFKVGAYTITIPKRPYLVLQDEDIQQIINTFSEYMMMKMAL